MQIPKDLLYTRKHAWVRVKDTVAFVGITDFLQETLESVDSVSLPAVGDELEMDIECVTIHHGNESYDVPSPLTGRVLAVNPDIRHKPDLVHSAPYSKGWLFKMEFDEPDELELLYKPLEYHHEVESGVGYDDE